jgi:hypothetical protein
MGAEPLAEQKGSSHRQNKKRATRGNPQEQRRDLSEAEMQGNDEEEEVVSESVSELPDERATDSAQALQQVFDDVVEANAFNAVLPRSVDGLADFSIGLKRLPVFEQTQTGWWYKQAIAHAAAHNLIPPRDHFLGVNEMIGQARCLLLEHRFGTLHRLNIGVLGPRRSGKSIFLQLLYNELLFELIAIDEWKKTFLFVLDMSDLATHAHDFIAFYRGMVAATFANLFWQRPHFQQYCRMVQNVFEGICSNSNPPPFPKAFARDSQTKDLAIRLTSLAAHLSSIWHQDNALLDWLVNVALFPQHIAQIFGFTRTIAVFDHFDTVDVSFTPEQSPFPGSPGAVWLHDALKVLLTHSHYIIGSQDENALCELLPSGTAEISIDLSETISYCSTVGLLFRESTESDGFLIKFAHDKRTWCFTSAVCGGIPAYLSQWDAFESAANAVTSEEDEVLLASTATEVLGVLLQSTGVADGSLEVVSCQKRDKAQKSE